MNFLSNILTITLIALFTFTASASTYTTTIDEGKEKKETVVKDENSKDKEDTDETSELTLNDLELTSEIVNKAKPAQLEMQNTNTTISLDLSINDKIEHSPKLN